MSYINPLGGGRFTSAILIADVRDVIPGGSTDAIPDFTKVNGQYVSAALEINSTLGALLNARLTQTEINNLIPYPGMQLYNLTEAAIQFYYGGTVDAWVTPIAESGTGVPNDIVIFGSSAGLIVDSGVKLLLNGGLSDNSNLFIGVNNGSATPGSLAVTNASFGNGNLQAINNGSRNYVLGVGNLSDLTTGNDNVTIGFQCLTSNATASRNVAISTSAMSAMTDASNNVDNCAIGYSCFAAATGILESVGIGSSVGKFATSIGGCTFVGYNVASQNAFAAVDLTGIGGFALENVNTGASRLTAIGWSAMQSATTAVRCTAAGYQALALITTSAGGADSNAFGNQCMIEATSALSSDGFGSQAFGTATTLLNSCALGESAGALQLQYTNCLFLGQGADASANNLTNASAIGQGSSVGVSNAMVLGKSGTFVGINTSSPTAAHLTNAGSEAINFTIVNNGSFPYTATSTDSVIIGYPSGNKTITIPDASAANYGRKLVIVNRATTIGSDQLTVVTTGGQEINSFNQIQALGSRTYIAVPNDGVSGNPGYITTQSSSGL